MHERERSVARQVAVAAAQWVVVEGHGSAQSIVDGRFPAAQGNPHAVFLEGLQGKQQHDTGQNASLLCIAAHADVVE